MPLSQFHMHLVSDATGETLESVAKACLAQFENVDPVKHFWPMVRSERQLDRVIDDIARTPGLVLFTLVNPVLHDRMKSHCTALGLIAVSVLDPVLDALTHALHQRAQGQPGRQHMMDARYFTRIEALHYTMAHDDGQIIDGLEQADIVLLGVSRTSKTPTSIYLANRGYKTGNVPLIPEIPVPDQLYALSKPLVVGLTLSPERLVQIRRSRELSGQHSVAPDYIDLERVSLEVAFARRLFARQNWPVIDVTRRSIEETAAAVIALFNRRHERSVTA